jgi:hypothetical protein
VFEEKNRRPFERFFSFYLHISIFYSTFAAQKIIAIQTAKEVFYQKQTYI